VTFYGPVLILLNEIGQNSYLFLQQRLVWN
jgi:hypothetical protein